MTAAFHPATRAWLEQTFGAPTPAQAQAWPAIAKGQDVLIAAPTGSGKTLAAFLAALDRLHQRAIEGPLPDATQVVYVSPLKALSNDIHRNLELPLSGIRAAMEAIGLAPHEVRVGLRTGDTPAKDRARMAKRPPHILVTTPESLYLLLTSESGRAGLATVRTLIVDEIHAVAGNRRGAHMALSVERLEHVAAQPVQRIGLSATQRPVTEVARFLLGSARPLEACTIVDTGHRRRLDLALELPPSPLEAVMAGEVWEEIYDRLAELISDHQTTLIFVNTRRLAERLSHNLTGRVGKHAVTAHHGSLSLPLRQEAERRLKQGELKAMVATASLELGIDIGDIDLVCQIGSPRSIATFLQRVGRSGHFLGGTPKGRLFPLSRDDLLECTAVLDAVAQGELDRVCVPEAPLDVLAQQVVAECAAEEWGTDALFALVRRAYPYRSLTRQDFDEVVAMLAQGFATRRGRRGALVHHDAIHGLLRARRGVRTTALTSGGAIPENADYRVLLEPAQTLVGTVNEDFAIESMVGDVFQLGNNSWQILQVVSGTVRVQDAGGAPPTIPFWLGEAPSRTDELSTAVSRLRQRLDHANASPALPTGELGLAEPAVAQLGAYVRAIKAALGRVPTKEHVVIERFFDEAGGMQLVIHSPYGARINKAWGLALRKRFCRSFNFELQAAATDDAIVLSLGEQHSFPLEDVLRFLQPDTARDVLVQALLDAPMFTTRWRWNANRSLAVPRFRTGKKVPPPFQRMQAEDLLAAVFPQQLACLENIVGDREIPDHPLVKQTLHDCLHEVMDVDGFVALLRGLERGQVAVTVLDLPEPSPLAHEILNARPYAFLDDAPLEERRTQAVYTRRSLEPRGAEDVGALDTEAIAQVRHEAWPRAQNADEVHDGLMVAGLVRAEEAEPWAGWLRDLAAQGRATYLQVGNQGFWLAAERWPAVRAAFPGLAPQPEVTVPSREDRAWPREEALVDLVQSRLEVGGPMGEAELAACLELPESDVALAAALLELRGVILRGRFAPGAQRDEWCERRLLARIHRLTLHRLRRDIEPVTQADFYRFLLRWHRVVPSEHARGPEGLLAVLRTLDGFHVAAGALESEVLSARVDGYDPRWLDGLCLSGRVRWGRWVVPQGADGRAFTSGPLQSSPVAVSLCEGAWAALPREGTEPKLTGEAQRVYELLRERGAQFFAALQERSGLIAGRLESALGQLVALGLVTSDSVAGLRALVGKRVRGRGRGTRRPRSGLGFEAAGRWSLLEETRPPAATEDDPWQGGWGVPHGELVERQARVLLGRYGVVFRRLLEREDGVAPWRDLARIYRRLEARGEIRGGHFVAGVSGEQFALAEVIPLLRQARRAEHGEDVVVLNATDPLNLVGILDGAARVPAVGTNRILVRGGVAVAALEGGEVRALEETARPLLGALAPLIQRSAARGWSRSA